ncbi:hypothetical protein F5051DRAFT_396679 [Lentinula edodes]|nr:hypothetical protein F5051DRAFT_396679 [Lentinula edodes]
MRFNAIWAYLALSLFSAVYAAPLSEADADRTTLAHSDSPSGVLHARRDGRDEYVVTFTKSGGGGRAARTKVVTPEDKDRVEALIITAAKKKWNMQVDPSKIMFRGNQYTSNTDAVPFTLKAPGLKECNPLPCKGEALYHVLNANNNPELGAGTISSQLPPKIIYDSANEIWED